MRWLKNLFKSAPVLTEKDLEWQRNFDERYGERMKKPGVLSSACPKCGSRWGWYNLGETDKCPLDMWDYRWVCLSCFHVWIDSEHEDPNGWWHTHSSKEECIQSLGETANEQ